MSNHLWNLKQMEILWDKPISVFRHQHCWHCEPCSHAKLRFVPFPSRLASLRFTSLPLHLPPSLPPPLPPSALQFVNLCYTPIFTFLIFWKRISIPWSLFLLMRITNTMYSQPVLKLYFFSVKGHQLFCCPLTSCTFPFLYSYVYRHTE